MARARLLVVPLLALAAPAWAAGPQATAPQATAPQATAQCVAAVDLRQALRTDHAERPVARGVTVNGWIVERFEHPNSGAWTLILVAPEGCGYFMAAGNDWIDIHPDPSEEKAI